MEAWGLWRVKAWASWLGCISAAIYLPLDVYALFRHPGWLSSIVLVVNLIVVAVLARDLAKPPLLIAYAPGGHPRPGNRMRSLLFVATLLALLPACQRDADATASNASSATGDFAYSEVGIAELQARMKQGALSSRALTQAYLDRIAAIDDAGPRLNAVIELNPDAIKEADARDAERQAGRVRSPMHGIPVLIKDNIDATPMVNSAGSLALANHRPKQDAFVIQRLRDAGAVILGKTNLSEWANFRSLHSVSGWSGRGGLTRNPYVLDRSACGSSSGTGSAIAASLAAAGIGTETNGSIICPSSVTGLVGLKPTVGLVSRNGIIPISSSQDTAGPMTRSVTDAAVLLGGDGGRDENDRVTANSVGRAVFDYPLHLNANGLRGARIGVLRQKMGSDAAVDAAMERAIATMRRAGAVVVDAQIPTDGQWDAGELDVLTWEFRAGLEHYLTTRGAPMGSLAKSWTSTGAMPATRCRTSARTCSNRRPPRGR